jgi:hypothetical protein
LEFGFGILAVGWLLLRVLLDKGRLFLAGPKEVRVIIDARTYVHFLPIGSELKGIKQYVLTSRLQLKHDGILFGRTDFIRGERSVMSWTPAHF